MGALLQREPGIRLQAGEEGRKENGRYKKKNCTFNQCGYHCLKKVRELF
jgi:hypothetical protein